MVNTLLKMCTLSRNVNTCKRLWQSRKKCGFLSIATAAVVPVNINMDLQEVVCGGMD
jgi:hypothetical protein